MLELSPEQVYGSDFMAANDSALVFDLPGLGKTAQSIVACDKARLRRILIICPPVVKTFWRREFERFSVYNRSIEIIEGRPKHTSAADVVIVSHAGVTQSHHALMLSGPWEAIIVDEAHYGRTWAAKLTQSIFGQEPYSLWKKTSAFWPMTGTPIVNSAFDLYPFIASGVSRRILAPMTGQQFMNEFTHMKMNFQGTLVPTGVKNEGQLWDMLKPFVLRRKQPDNIQEVLTTFPLAIDDNALKPIIAELQGIDPEKIEQRLLDDMEVEDEAISRVRHAMGLAKAKSAAQYIEYLLSCVGSGPVVGFFLHTEVRKRIIDHLEKAGLRVAFIDGKSKGNAQDACDKFQAGQLDVLLVQYVKGGTGLTLTYGNRVVAIEYPWTFVALKQAIARVARKTQTQAVFIDVLYAEGCWLEAVQSRVVDQKMRTAMKVLRT